MKAGYGRVVVDSCQRVLYSIHLRLRLRLGIRNNAFLAEQETPLLHFPFGSAALTVYGGLWAWGR